MELLYSSLLGCLFGILAAWLFWKYLLFLKPKVEISPFIVAENGSVIGENVYKFKILNNGNRQVINVVLNAWLCELMDVPGGKITTTLAQFNIRKSDTLTLSPAKNNERPWGLTPEATFRFIPHIDLEKELLPPNRRIMIALKVSDAVSGTTVVQQKTYFKKDIIYGEFKFGASLAAQDFDASTWTP